MPLHEGQAFKHMSLWGPYLFKPPYKGSLYCDMGRDGYDRNVPLDPLPSDGSALVTCLESQSKGHAITTPKLVICSVVSHDQFNALSILEEKRINVC